MQPFPLQIGPPRDEDHYNERKAGWKKMFEGLTSNPALLNAMLSFGSTAMQPTVARGAGAQVGSIGRGLASASDTYAQSIEAQQIQAERERRGALEEKQYGLAERRTTAEEQRTAAETERSAADVKRLEADTERIRAEIKDLPQQIKDRHELAMKQIDQAIKAGNLHDAELKIKQQELKLMEDPQYQALQKQELEAKIAEANARARAANAQKAGGPDAQKIQFLVDHNMDFNEAADLVFGKGTYLTDKRMRESADDIGDRIAAEWKATGGKDARGKPLNLDTWMDSQLQRWATVTNGKMDFVGMVGKAATQKITGTTAPGVQTGGPGSLKTRPVRPKDVEATMNATGMSREDVIKAMQAQGYDVSGVVQKAPEAQGMDSGN
jgi:hypothetical protein